MYDIEKYENNRGLNIDLMDEMKSCSKTNINEIIDMIENKEYDYDELKRFREKYIETMDTKNSERIVEYITNKTKK